ncbi:EAL domain-containing protein [Enterobacter soli]|uniref:EAL domain-containing protein n=1 Tax=Enterobacter soli TaxID=885040 RepID=UPI002148C930|nr:EAL domain-containing protein [Enterobacter soli]MCR1317790.1 EAL domain-containing protein [Enterobacter soli]MDR7940182.1 EAL domain-containing protein [Enterobacter soli]HDR2474017.1 EAL domain-containing protein [Enterobacter soli]
MTTSTRRTPPLFSGIGALLSRVFAITPAGTLLDAIKQNQIVPFYQPFFDSQTGKIAGIEVLARWKHPLYGHISPDTFIPLAEKYNLIALLTHQLIQQVIADLQHRVQFFPDGLYICLNLSAHNCLDPRFESDTVELLHKLDAGQVQVVIEITERHPLHFTPQLSEWFATLRKSNIAVALDDFGTGYSNLSYIHALAPEFIKIDKLFVSQIDENGDTRLVDSLIELANKMQLRIIAEGVETQCQADYLRGKKIDFMQGYHFSRAVHIEELIRMTMLQKGHTTQ